MVKDYLIELTPTLRVSSDELQWIVQRKQGKIKIKWEAIAFCRSKAGLILRLKPLIGEMPSSITALPDWREG